MTGPEGTSEFCFPRSSMFPSTSSRETLRFEGNKINCCPLDQSLSVNCFPIQSHSNCHRNRRRWNSIRRLNYHYHCAASRWPTAGWHWAHHGCWLVPVSDNSSCFICFCIIDILCNVFFGMLFVQRLSFCQDGLIPAIPYLDVSTGIASEPLSMSWATPSGPV